MVWIRSMAVHNWAAGVDLWYLDFPFSIEE